MTERHSTVIAALAMAAMFSVGISFGIALDHRVLHRPPRPAVGGGGEPGLATFRRPPDGPGRRGPPPNADRPGPGRALDVFAHDLELSTIQRSVADSILRHEFQTIDAIRSEAWPRMRVVMEETRRKLDSLLTPSQRDRYHAMLADQDRQFRERGPGRPPHPPDR